MAARTEPNVIEVNNGGELTKVARTAKQRGASYLLRSGGEDLALVVPVSRRRAPVKRRVPTAADHAAFLAAAGSWRDVDTDALVAQIYVDRERPSGPRVEL